MSEIDELSGVALARAVAEARGWVLVEESSSGEAGLNLWRMPNGKPDLEANLPRPDCDIAQAFELVEMCNLTIAPKMTGVDPEKRVGTRTGWAIYDCLNYPLAFANVPTIYALCTAICRAFLKAKGYVP